MNQKQLLAASKVVYTAKLVERKLWVVDNFPDISKTKHLHAALQKFGTDPILLLTHEHALEKGFFLASRNLKKFRTADYKEANVVDILGATNLFISPQTLLHLEEFFKDWEARLYRNRSIPLKAFEPEAEPEPPEPVVVTARMLKEVVNKYGLEIETK